MGIVSGGQAATLIGGQAAEGFVMLGPLGAAVGAATGLIQSLFGANRDAPLKKYTTNIVKQVEPYMKQNLAAWQSSDKSCAEQQACISNFNTLWNQVVNACNRPDLGGPGQACIDDRKRGGQWDWFSYYLDPIVNDACTSQTFGVEPLVAGLSSSPLPLLLAAGLLLYAVAS
jgi:hypothetical protein